MYVPDIGYKCDNESSSGRQFIIILPLLNIMLLSYYFMKLIIDEKKDRPVFVMPISIFHGESAPEDPKIPIKSG